LSEFLIFIKKWQYEAWVSCAAQRGVQHIKQLGGGVLIVKNGKVAGDFFQPVCKQKHHSN
jgi:hypothetical protein